jgi:hypothetical protein
MLEARTRRRRCDLGELLQPARAEKSGFAYQGLLEARGEPGAVRLPAEKSAAPPRLLIASLQGRDPFALVRR